MEFARSGAVGKIHGWQLLSAFSAEGGNPGLPGKKKPHLPLLIPRQGPCRRPGRQDPARQGSGSGWGVEPGNVVCRVRLVLVQQEVNGPLLMGENTIDGFLASP